MDDLKIIVQAILNKDSIPTIEKQLNELKTKYGNNIISINIDSNILSTLQSFTKAMENFKAVTASQISVNNNVSESIKKEAQAVNELTAAQAKYNVEKQKTTTADTYKTTSNTVGTKFDNTTTSRTDYANGEFVDHPVIQNIDTAGLERASLAESEKIRIAKEKADADHLKQTRANLLQEENEWKNFVTSQQQSYDKYITTTGKGLLQEDKDFNDFVSKQEQNYNKLNAATNKSLLQEENELKSFVAKQEQSYQKYLSDREKNLQKEQQIRQAIAEAQTKQDISQSKLGTNVGTSPKFGLDFKEAQDYAKSLTGVDAELRNIGYSVNSAGEKIQTLNIQTKEGGKYQKDWTATLNQATGQTHLFEKGLSDVATRSLGFVEALKAAMVRLPTFLLAGAVVGGSLGFITDGIKYVNEFNATLTQIGTAVNYSQGKLASLGQQFQQLGKDLKASTADVATGVTNSYILT